MRKRVGLLALAFGVAALAVASVPGTAEAQLFRKNQQKVVVNNAGNAPVQVRQVNTRGGLFNRQQITEVNVGQPQRFVRQPANIVINNHHQAPANIVVNNHATPVNVQLVQRQKFRGQLDQLNTYSYVHNAPANIRFVTQNQVYVQPQQLVQAPVQVQSYTVQTAAPVVVQEYTQPCVDTAAAPAAAPAAGDPNVQYLTQPQRITNTTYSQPARVVERVVTVNRPVAVTENRYYVQTRPARVRQFVQHNCS